MASYRKVSGDLVDAELERIDANDVLNGLPVRIPPAYSGQRHYPGLFWSSTTGTHLMYESLLESRWL